MINIINPNNKIIRFTIRDKFYTIYIHDTPTPIISTTKNQRFCAILKTGRLIIRVGVRHLRGVISTFSWGQFKKKILMPPRLLKTLEKYYTIYIHDTPTPDEYQQRKYQRFCAILKRGLIISVGVRTSEASFQLFLGGNLKKKF